MGAPVVVAGLLCLSSAGTTKRLETRGSG
jgi:hypothetical protein